MTTTPNLGLGLLAAAQSQKHVTMNEALLLLDATVQLAVESRTVAAPPASPADGQRWIVPAGATGAFAGHDDTIAVAQDGVLGFVTPHTGWLCWIADEGVLLVHDGSAWSAPPGTAIGGALALESLGIGTAVDPANTVAVKAANLLFAAREAAAGGSGDLRFKLNKETAGNTVSQLYQTGYSGRAETGLTGDDHFRIRVSADGTSWADGMAIDPAGAAVSLPGGSLAVGSDALVVSGGRVGINRAAPSDVLHLYGGEATSLIRLESAGTGYTAQLLFSRGSHDTYAGPTADGYFDIFSTECAQGVRIATAGSFRLIVDSAGNTTPGADNSYSCGSATARWSSVWAVNGTIQTSDERDKQVAGTIAPETGARFMAAILPRLYRWRRDDGTGGRLHAGFLAQDWKRALDAAGLDCGVRGLDDAGTPDSRQWLRPDEQIPFLWAALQHVMSRLAALEGRAGA